MKQEVKIDQTDYSVLIFIPDSASTDGSGKTGLVAANLTVSGVRVETDNDVTVTDYTSSLNNLAALTTAHTDWGILEVSNTLAPGLYRLDIADAIFATGAWSAVVYVMVTTSAAAASPMEFVLVPDAPVSGVAVSSIAANAITATSIASDAITDAKVASDVTIASVTGAVGSVAAGGITAASFAANAITAAKLDPDVTTELQAGLATASALAAVAVFIDTEVASILAAVDTEVAAILADTNELQTDWVDGGRLDLILDARSSQTSVDTIDGIVDSILVDTAEIGAAGAGLTVLATQASVDTIDNFLDLEIAAILAAVDTEVAAILADTNELQTDWANGGRLDLILDARASQTSVDTIDGIVDDILVDTAEIGAAGAGLTAINLPDQTMNITGNITGNLSGTVGSVTGAVGSVTGNVGGNVTGTIGGLTAAALKDFFDTDSTTDYASAVAGSVVKEIADNAGGAALTAADIADAVWDEAQADHVGAGTFGITASEIADILVDTAEIGAAGAGLTNINLPNQTMDIVGSITGNLSGSVGSVTGLTASNLDATISSRASQASADDLPTNAELATALGTADDATLAAVAALSIPTANQNADALLDRANAIETGLTPRQALRLSAAADGGKLSGAATVTNVIRNAVADDKDRITATVDADGNRTAITYDLT